MTGSERSAIPGSNCDWRCERRPAGPLRISSDVTEFGMWRTWWQQHTSEVFARMCSRTSPFPNQICLQNNRQLPSLLLWAIHMSDEGCSTSQFCGGCWVTTVVARVEFNVAEIEKAMHLDRGEEWKQMPIERIRSSTMISTFEFKIWFQILLSVFCKKQVKKLCTEGVVELSELWSWTTNCRGCWALSWTNKYTELFIFSIMGQTMGLDGFGLQIYLRRDCGFAPTWLENPVGVFLSKAGAVTMLICQMVNSYFRTRKLQS